MKKDLSNKFKALHLSDDSTESAGSNQFKVPDAYFESLQSEIISKIESLSELETVASKNQFSVPPNYFEELPIQIQQKTSIAGKIQLWKEWMALLIRPQIGLAFASLILILFLGLRTRQTVIVESSVEPITLEDLGNSLYLNDVDEFTLIDILAAQQESDASNTSTNPYVQYLLENDIDISQIENSL